MTFLKELFLVGCGGFVGSALRFVVGGWAQRTVPFGAFPYGTLVVNVSGCVLIGFLGGLVEYRQLLDPAQRLFLLVGILGGFTTFSTFAYESLALAQDGEIARAAANVFLQVVLGLAAALCGYVGARMI